MTSPGIPSNNSQSGDSNSSFENINSNSSSSFTDIQSTSTSSSTSPPVLSSNLSESDELNDNFEHNNMILDDKKDTSSSSSSSTTTVNTNNGADQQQQNGTTSSTTTTTTCTTTTTPGTETTTTTTNDESNTSTTSNGLNGAPAPDTTTTPTTIEYKMIIPTKPDLTKEKILKKLKKSQTIPMTVGDTWYLVQESWYRKWSTGMFSKDDLGPIDNRGFLLNEIDIKPGMAEDRDFMIVPEKLWNTLKDTYGGGPEVGRKVVKQQSLYGNPVQIDLRIPVTLKFCKSTEPKTFITGYAYKSETISVLKERICKIMGLDPLDVRIWDYYNENKHAELKNSEYVKNSNLIENQNILLDQRLADGTWPKQNNHYTTSSAFSSMGGSSYGSSTYGSGSSFSSSYGSSHHYHSRPTSKPGLTGLGNLGNTCFMNSAIQCLSNAEPLTQYFLSKRYENDINKNNPLGCGGDLAMNYAQLINELWSPDMGYVYPRYLKEQIERFAPQFGGYQQHDSQELLAFLLDGLHEDLNKVINKPFFEGKDYDGRPDQVVSKEHWDMHKARNDSIIVDWFQSQLKSELVCPKCNKVSITFDPFMYLSLPFPTRVIRCYNVTFVPYDANIPSAQHDLRLERSHSSVEHIIEALSPIVKVPTDQLVIGIVNNGLIKVCEKSEIIDDLPSRDSFIGAFQILPDTDDVKYHHVRVKMVSPSLYRSLQPFFLSIPTTVKTQDEIYLCIVEKLRDSLKDYEFVINTFKTAGNNESEDQQKDQESAEAGDKDENNISINGTSNNGSTTSTSSVDPIDQDENTPGDASNDRHHINSYGPINRNSYSFDHYGSSTSNYNHVNSYHHHNHNNYHNHHMHQQQQQQRKALPINSKYIFNIQPIPPNAKDLLEIETITVEWDDNVERYLDTTKARQTPYYMFRNQPSEKEIPLSNEVSLEDCIKLFTTKEQLGPDDPWYCNRCKEHQRATKKFDIWSAPPILVVHLKRFSYKKNSREKIDALVKFPIENFDLSDHVLAKGDNQPAPKYNLFAVSNHYGSLSGGHYTAYALNHTEKTWYKFDDSSVSQVHNVNDIITSAAYVLFYRRVDTTEPSFYLNTHLQNNIATADANNINNSDINNNNNNSSNTDNSTAESSSTTTTTTTSNLTSQQTTTTDNINGTTDSVNEDTKMEEN
eukprot:gene9067-11105_t